MAIIDEKYRMMSNMCRKYQENIELLKNQVYGYNIYLDYIIPYKKTLMDESNDGECFGFDEFSEKIIEYYSEFSKDTSDCFNNPLTSQDKTYIRNLLTCIFTFLKYECEHYDYTFLGLTKILKTFIGETSENEAYDLKKSTFWIMYQDSSEKDRYPETSKQAFLELFKNFDYNYASRIADGTFYCVRFFLYDQGLDYISDRLMRMATIDMLEETKNRLDGIYVNRKPRDFRRY